MALPASDDFATGSAQNLQARSGWSAEINTIYNNLDGTISPWTSGDEACAYWDADSFDDDQVAELEITVEASVLFLGPAVRAGNGVHYFGFYVDNYEYYVFEYDGSNWDTIANVTDLEWDPPYTLKMEIEGATTSKTLTIYKDDEQLYQYTGATVNGGPESGSCGVCSYDTGTASKATAWTGDNIGGAGPTLKTGSDSLSVSLADAVDGIYGVMSRSDSLSVSISDVINLIYGEANRSDSLQLAITNEVGQIAAILSRADTVTLSLTDTVDSILSSLNRTDSLALTLVDVVSSILSSLSRADTVTVSITDETSTNFSVLLRSDDLTVSAVDIAQTIVSALNRSDTVVISIVEGTPEILTNLTAADSLSLQAVDAVNLIYGEMTVSDSLSLQIVEAINQLYGAMSRTDALLISVVESSGVVPSSEATPKVFFIRRMRVS